MSFLFFPSDPLLSSREEYEYMNNQNFSARPPPKRRSRLPSDDSYRSPGSRHPVKKRSSIDDSESSGAVSQFSTDEQSRSEDEDPRHGGFLKYDGEYVDSEEERHTVEYELVDVLNAGKPASASPLSSFKFNFLDVGSSGMELTASPETDWLEEDAGEARREEDYQYMNRQPRLKQRIMGE